MNEVFAKFRSKEKIDIGGGENKLSKLNSRIVYANNSYWY